jgi:hypothetical protein
MYTGSLLLGQVAPTPGRDLSILEPNCFTAEVAEAAERATDARRGRESQEQK